VLPLSLYLLTWVLVFQSRPLLPHKWMLMAQPVAIGGILVSLAVGGEQDLLLTLGAHQVCFFVIAMACHGELARTRPPASHLTEFYVALSFGGMVGGLFAGLVAPYAFSWIAEYPILLALAALCRPAGTTPVRGASALWLVMAAAAVVLIVISFWSGPTAQSIETNRLLVAKGFAVGLMVLGVLWKLDRWKLAALVTLVLVLIRVYPADEGRVETVRSFFGVHKIVVTPNGQYHVLMHGTTIHGAQKFWRTTARR